MKLVISRRTFIKGGAAITLPTLIPASAFGANERLTVGVIGTGGRSEFLLRIVRDTKLNIAAICDVDTQRIRRIREMHPDLGAACVQYSDYRELLDTRNDVDAVIVATPDHWHTVICKHAIETGKHIYCEKPLTRTVAEARELRQLAHAHTNLITQTGNQGTSSIPYRRSVDILRSGLIGSVRDVVGALKYQANAITAPVGADPIPEELNWDFWCGPSSLRDYKKGIYHPFKWRHWYDFGGGVLSDFGSHIFPVAMEGLQLGDSERIDIKGEGLGMDGIPIWAQVNWHYPVRGTLPPVTLQFCFGKGHGTPPEKMVAPLKETFGAMRDGIMLFGDKGTLFLGPWNSEAYIKFNDEPKFKGIANHPAVKAVPELLPKPPVGGHVQAWVDGIRTGKQTYSSFDFGARLAELANLGVVACRTGNGFNWDGAKMMADDAQAMKFISQQNRKCNWL